MRCDKHLALPVLPVACAADPVCRWHAQMHNTRDEMHGQLEYIDNIVSRTDIEKPDTALPNLGMDANDDLADLLKVWIFIQPDLLCASTYTRTDVYAC